MAVVRRTLRLFLRNKQRLKHDQQDWGEPLLKWHSGNVIDLQTLAVLDNGFEVLRKN